MTSQKYTSGKFAHRVCDNCGLAWDYDKLSVQFYAQKPTGSLHCPDCLDVDHPQLVLRPITVDPIALKDARPNNGDMGDADQIDFSTIR